MRTSWQTVVDSVLRPRRPHLARCQVERERHLEERKNHAAERTLAINRCMRRIEDARAIVFAADDGVVGSRMTTLEREWRMLSRRDPDSGLMDLWARIAPGSWIDRKMWRDTTDSLRLDAAIALASDADGVESAESAIDSLRRSVGSFGPRIRWRMFDEARDAFSSFDDDEVDHDVHDAVLARFSSRPKLAHDIARAAFMERAMPEMVTALRDLWKTGYVLSAIDESGVTLEIPPLQ
jgi:hypothetical protein